jgi:hypothetical protein
MDYDLTSHQVSRGSRHVLFEAAAALLAIAAQR